MEKGHTGFSVPFPSYSTPPILPILSILLLLFPVSYLRPFASIRG
jgi:hypothetical protein